MPIEDPYPWAQEGPTLEERLRRLFEEAMKHSVGPTEQRPNDPPVGTMYFDMTLGKPVWWTGSHWKDATGSMV